MEMVLTIGIKIQPFPNVTDGEKIIKLQTEMTQLQSDTREIKEHLVKQDSILNRFMGALILINLLIPIVLKFWPSKP
jgi:hypothetical protein